MWSQENQHILFKRVQQERLGVNIPRFILEIKIKNHIYEFNLTTNK